jgi:lipopolysaccharide transport system ATP-binding protein
MECAVRLDHVTKRFRRYRPHAPHTTLKTALVEWIRGRGGRTGLGAGPERFDVIHDASLAIERGETVGLIGRNGAGKTTLLKLIAGIYRPDEGRIAVTGRVAALLELGAGFHPDFTGRENVLLSGIVHGLTKREVRERFDRIVEFSGIGEFIEAPVRTYSAGMFMRLAFSLAIHVEPDILLIDEILSVGDEVFQRKSRAFIEDRIRSRRQTTVIVSHDVAAIEALCHRVALLDPPRVLSFDSPSEAVLAFRGLMGAGDVR